LKQQFKTLTSRLARRPLGLLFSFFEHSFLFFEHSFLFFEQIGAPALFTPKFDTLVLLSTINNDNKNSGSLFKIKMSEKKVQQSFQFDVCAMSSFEMEMSNSSCKRGPTLESESNNKTVGGGFFACARQRFLQQDTQQKKTVRFHLALGGAVGPFLLLEGAIG
jgi:hypothetical protein